MAAHRYWRFYITANQNGTTGYLSIYEVRFFFNGQPIFPTGVVTNSSSVYMSNTAANTLDGNITVGWVSALNGIPGWVSYDFGAGNSVEIDGYIMWAAVSSYLERAPKNLKLQFSDDNTIWTDAAEITNQGTPLVLYNVIRKAIIPPFPLRRNMIDGGNHRIIGNVDELGVAGSYRVRLFDRQSARCIQEIWSAADGSYAFNYIAYRPNGYFVVAYDHGDNPLNAAIADLITPELMP